MVEPVRHHLDCRRIARRSIGQLARLFETDFVAFADELRSQDSSPAQWPIEIGPFRYDTVCDVGGVIYIVGDSFYSARVVVIDTDNHVTIASIRGESFFNGCSGPS